MSETKRTIETIHKEYSELCAKAGHLNYQIYTLSKDLELVNQQLRDLNLEASALSAAESVKKEEK